MTDAIELRRAVAAVAAIIGRAGSDPQVTANEIIQALRGHGWRPPQPPPMRHPAAGQPPLRGDAVHAIADRIRADLGANPLDHLDTEDLTRQEAP